MTAKIEREAFGRSFGAVIQDFAGPMIFFFLILTKGEKIVHIFQCCSLQKCLGRWTAIVEYAQTFF